ncbi:hypothetical protein GOV12_02850 [Candidatus Pacearchaeota archaeon]|nr:hypothetical protein [Candidatus Pacearchaeota archaeon]
MDITITAQRLLKDSEIVNAIKRNFITIDDPNLYLNERRDDLIQPASMDLILLDSGSNYPIIELDIEHKYYYERHEDVDDRFVTFWPGYQTEAVVSHLKGYNGEIIMPCPELRSTLRRVGLDIGFKLVGLNEDKNAFLFVRNPQDYPVSVRTGEKIAQVLWKDIGTKISNNRFETVERKEKFGSGRLVTSDSELLELIESGDLYVSEKECIDRGYVLFHAGNVRTFFNQEHVVIGKNGVIGFDLKRDDAINHYLYPGEFSDIETIERIGLSPRVGMQVFYVAKSIDEVKNTLENINRILTLNSTGGWIDPGYGFGKVGGAPFSVQRKAFTQPCKIRKGDLVGYGVVWKFPEPVEKVYSSGRGSHYNEAIGFVGPKK